MNQVERFKALASNGQEQIKIVNRIFAAREQAASGPAEKLFAYLEKNEFSAKNLFDSEGNLLNDANFSQIKIIINTIRTATLRNDTTYKNIIEQVLPTTFVDNKQYVINLFKLIYP